jgi:hypothetical protein
MTHKPIATNSATPTEASPTIFFQLRLASEAAVSEKLSQSFKYSLMIVTCNPKQKLVVQNPLLKKNISVWEYSQVYGS